MLEMFKIQLENRGDEKHIDTKPYFFCGAGGDSIIIDIESFVESKWKLSLKKWVSNQDDRVLNGYAAEYLDS